MRRLLLPVLLLLLAAGAAAPEARAERVWVTATARERSRAVFPVPAGAAQRARSAVLRAGTTRRRVRGTWLRREAGTGTWRLLVPRRGRRAKRIRRSVLLGDGSARAPAAPPASGPAPSAPQSPVVARPAPASPPIGISAVLRWKAGDELERTLRLMRSANLRVSREDLSWRRVEGVRGRDDWTHVDRMVGAAARHGIELVLVPDDPPSWATPAWNVPPLDPTARQAFAAFVRRAVARYGSRGSFWAANPELPKRPVRWWNIWNEPHWPGFWGNTTPDPVAYARLFRDVVRAAEPADPAARFMLEADTGIGAGEGPYLGAMLDAVPEVKTLADAVGVHPYASGAPETCSRPDPSRGVDRDWIPTRWQLCRLQDVRRILDARGATGMQIWATELGWPTKGEVRSVSEATQAAYVRTTFRLLRRWRLVSGLVWYQLKDNGGSTADREGWFGFRRPDDGPKPSWAALADEARLGLPAPG